MLQALRRRNFALLWAGTGISMVGDWSLFAALPVYVYHTTGSTLATSAMFMIQVLPRLLIGSIAGVFADRWDRKRTLVSADFLRSLLVFSLLTVPLFDWVFMVYLVGFFESLVSQFAFPSERALTPVLAGRENLTAANSLIAVTGNLARIAGPGLGGALMGFFGLTAVVLVDATSYLLSGLLIARIAMPPKQSGAGSQSAAAEPEAGEPEGGGPEGGGPEGVGLGERSPAQAKPRTARPAWRQTWQEWYGGLQLVGRNRVLAGLFLVVGLAMLGDAMISPLLAPFVEDLLAGSEGLFGLLLAVRGAGGLAGGFLMGQFGSRIPSGLLITGGLAGCGLAIALLINLPSVPLAVAVMALVGIPAVAWMISVETAIQKAAPEQYLGRVFGTYGTVTAATMLVGLAVSGVLGDTLGLVLTLNGSAALYLAAALAAVVLLPELLSGGARSATPAAAAPQR